MTRVVMAIVLPLLLPTAIYVLWAVSFGRAALAGPGPAWRTFPWIWLAATGIALVALVLAAATQFGGNDKGTYVAPHLENGALVPGHVVPAPPGR